MIVEIACNNYTSCLHAQKGGADRIELFENISEGGCTPSFGLMKRVKEFVQLPIYTMIRPRGGDFVYSSDEIEIMKSDINTCRVLAINGIVFGALTHDGKVDKHTCVKLLQTWRGQPATFHRAFDRTIDLDEAMEDIISLGFERVLTSGGYANVEEGKDMLQYLQQTYGQRIKILAGSGVTPQNAAALIAHTGVNEIHATCKQSFMNETYQYNNRFQDTYPVSDWVCIEQLVHAVKNQ